MFRWFRLCGWAIFFVFFTYTIVGAVPPKVDVRPVGRDGQTHSSPILPLPHPLPESGPRAGRSAPTDLSLLHSDERGVIFRYTPPEPSFQIKRMEEGTFSDLFFPGTTYPSPKAGQPMLPFLLVHLGLPLKGEVRVEIENLRSSPHSHQYPITPFPKPDGAYEGDKEVYGRDGLYPGKWVEREGISYIRNQRVLSLRVYPVQFNATRKTLQILEEIQIRVEFLSGDGVGAGLRPVLTDPFEKVYEKVLINYEEAKGWRRRAGRSSPSILSSRPWLKISTNEAGIYRLTYKELIRTGAPVNFIDPRTFQMFNGGSDTLPQALATPRPDSVEISLYIRGEEDSTFNPGDEIFFYGMPLTGWRMEGDTLRFHRNPYTDVNVYWLTWDGGMGKRMVSLDGSLSEPNPIRPDRYEEVLHLEEEVANPQKSGLAWIWQILNRSASQSIVSYSFPFALSDLASSVGEIRLNLYGRSTTLHNVRVHLNGNQVADSSWVSPNNETIQNIPVVLSPLVSQFREGGNTIKIEEYRTSPVASEVYFDYAEVKVERRFVAKREVLDFTSPVGVLGRTEFTLSGFSQLPMILDVSDPFRPLRVENASFQSDTVRFQDDLSTRKRYIVASTFQQPIRMVRDSPTDLKTGGAHYIALCHDDFYDAVLPLIQWREEHLADADISNPIVERVRVSDVYDNFSWGVVDPTAIRDFLKFTHDTLTSWSPKPVYCLFVGAGSYDYKNNMRLFPHKNFLPPHQKGGRVVTNSPFPQDLNPGFDQWFVVFDTAASAKPQIHLGRITVTSPQETRTVVEKIIDYEKKKAYGPWRNRVLLAADDVYSSASFGYPSEGLFTNQCQTVANNLEPETDVIKIYMADYYRGTPLDEMPLAREALIRGMDEGFLAGLFLGHGNIDQIAHEKLFRNPVDIFALRNGPKNFFFYFGSCSVGQFDRPEKEDLASTLQKRRDGGGIATFAASRSSYASPNATLANRLFDNFFFNDTAKTIGKVITTTKIQLGNSQQNYNLFGDPASEWGPPELDVDLTLFSDSALTDTTDSLIGLSQVTVQGEVSDPSFNGFASLTIFDSGDSTSNIFITPPPANDTFILKYTLPGNPIYKGVTRVLNGQFTQSFIVPDHKGGAMQLGDLGRVSVYIWDGVRDGHGALDNLFVGAGGTLEDTIPPKITLLHGGRVLTGMDPLTVPLNPRIILILEDESGIYLGDRPDRRIHLVKDGDKDNRIFLNHLFQYEEGSYTRGRVEVDLQFSDPRDDTTHTLVFSASDNALNRSADTVVVKVIPSQRLALYRVMNYPNPVQKHRTRFIFELSEENVEVEIKVYTVAGRLIKILRVPGRVGFNSVEWDCRDEVGDAIANGVYLYKVVARTMSTGFTTSTEKVVEVVEKLIIAH